MYKSNANSIIMNPPKRMQIHIITLYLFLKLFSVSFGFMFHHVTRTHFLSYLSLHIVTLRVIKGFGARLLEILMLAVIL